MKLRRAIASAAPAALLVAAACTTFGDGTGAVIDADAGAGADASAADSTAAEASTEGGDGGVGADCSVVIDDDFAQLETWTPYAEKTPTVANGELRLIDETFAQGAALRWPTPIAARRFIVHATFRIGSKGPDAAGIGDSLAFAWMPASVPFATAAKGNDAFICGGTNTGNVVVVSSSTRRLRIGTLPETNCGTGGPIVIQTWDTNPHTLAFEVIDREVRATFDAELDAATAARADATLPAGYTPFHFIVSAASGQSHAAHSLQRIVVEACN